MKFIAALLLTVSLSAHAQTKTDTGLLLADAGVRALDIYSTHQALQNGNREIILPQFVVNHMPVYIGLESVAMIGRWILVRKLEQHGHPKWAHAIPLIDMATDAPGAIHNLYLPDNR